MMVAADRELIARLVAAEAESWMSGNRWLIDKGLEADTDWWEVDGAVAFVTAGIRIPMFNRVLGVEARHAGTGIDAIVRGYRQRGIPPRFDLCPELSSPGLEAALFESGLERGTADDDYRRFRVLQLRRGRSGGGELVAQGCGGADELPRGDVVVRAMTATDGDIDDWMAIDLAAFGGRRADLRGRLMATLDQPGVRRFLAFVEGKAAGLGRMHLVGRRAGFAGALPDGSDGGIVLLNGGGTLPELRGRGCQQALIAARVAEAVRLGAEMAVSLVAPGSASDRNLERAGFVVACDREIWMERAWREDAFYDVAREHADAEDPPGACIDGDSGTETS